MFMIVLECFRDLGVIVPLEYQISCRQITMTGPEPQGMVYF